MKIIASIKQVPASESKIVIKNDAIDYNNISYVVNPYDEFAIEEAIRIKERFGNSEVVAISMGAPKAAESLRTCLAVGADRAILITTVDMQTPAGISLPQSIIKDSAEFQDSFVTATILAALIKKEEPDIILFGKQAIDDDAGAVGIQVAEILGIAHVSAINKLEILENKAIAHRQIEGGTEVVEVKLPALFTCQKGLNEPRYASLPGIMKAKSKPFKTETLDSLGIDLKTVQNSITITKFTPPPPRTSGKIIEGESKEAAKTLIKLLREEAGVI